MHLRLRSLSKPASRGPALTAGRVRRIILCTRTTVAGAVRVHFVESTSVVSASTPLSRLADVIACAQPASWWPRPRWAF